MSASEHIWKKAVRIAGCILLLLVFYVPLLLLNIFPHRPRGFIGWLILICVGVPVALALEALSNMVLSEQRSRAISSARFSGIRMLFALAFILVVFGALYGIGFIAWPHIQEYFF